MNEPLSGVVVHVVNVASAVAFAKGGAKPSGDQFSSPLVDIAADEAFSGELILLGEPRATVAVVEHLAEGPLHAPTIAEPPHLVALAARAEPLAAPASIPATATEALLAPAPEAQFRPAPEATGARGAFAEESRTGSGASRGAFQRPKGEAPAGSDRITQAAKDESTGFDEVRWRPDPSLGVTALAPGDAPDDAPTAAAPARSLELAADRSEPAPAAPPPSGNDGGLWSVRAGAPDDLIALAKAASAEAGPDPFAGTSAPVRAPVAFEVASIARRDDGVLELRLDPPDLGAVSIRFTEGENGELLAFLNADEPATLELLRRHGELLQRELTRHGAGDFTLSFADRRDGRGATDAGGGRRIYRFGETPEAFVATQTPVSPRFFLGRIDLVA